MKPDEKPKGQELVDLIRALVDRGIPASIVAAQNTRRANAQALAQWLQRRPKR